MCIGTSRSCGIWLNQDISFPFSSFRIMEDAGANLLENGSSATTILIFADVRIIFRIPWSPLLCAVMPQASVQDVIYEITSAIATVGLSRGLTSQLNLAGKWIVILTMYLGRIGPLTLGTAVTVRAQKMPANSHLAEEDIMIG